MVSPLSLPIVRLAIKILIYRTMHDIFSFRPAPKNEDEMMEAIFECIDRLFCIVRPRKVLYMAIDGVVSTNVLEKSILAIETVSDCHFSVTTV